MTVKIIKSSWWVDFSFNHVRYRKRSPENSRAGAQAYEAMLRQKLARGEKIDAPAPQQEELFATFSRRWFDDYVVPNNKYSEQRTKKYILDASLIPFFGKMPVGQIAAYHIEQYKARLVKDGLSGKTIKNRLTVLNKCLASAYEWLKLGATPPKIKWPKYASHRTDYLSAEESELLVSCADGVTRELILTGLRTGMRQGELKGLQWSSIDWQNRSVAVRHSRCDYRKTLDSPKSNRERHIPLDSDVYEMLYRRREPSGYVFTDADGEPFDHQRLNRQLTGTCRKAGLRRITWHVLRHTFASHLAMRGVPLHIVQTLLGHSNIAMTMRYAHVAPSALRPAIDMLSPKQIMHSDLGQPAGNHWLIAQQQQVARKDGVANNP